MDSVYWTVYNRIEKEVLELSYNIQFTDKQLKVYSVKIADLILRIAVEIEAISKELYRINGGNMNPQDDEGKTRSLYFDTDCINLLDSLWDLQSKEINISCLEFHFSDDYRRIAPLKKSSKRGTSGSKWKIAYMSLKHNRSANIELANVKNLIDILGSLFILNLYYYNETIYLGHGVWRKPFDDTRNSLIFKASYIKNKIDFSLMDDFAIKPLNINKYIYILQIPSRVYKEQLKNKYNKFEKIKIELNKCKEYLEYCKKTGYVIKINNRKKIKGMFKDGKGKIIEVNGTFDDFDNNLGTLEARLNKSDNIYPVFSLE